MKDASEGIGFKKSIAWGDDFWSRKSTFSYEIDSIGGGGGFGGVDHFARFDVSNAGFDSNPKIQGTIGSAWYADPFSTSFANTNPGINPYQPKIDLMPMKPEPEKQPLSKTETNGASGSINQILAQYFNITQGSLWDNNTRRWGK